MAKDNLLREETLSQLARGQLTQSDAAARLCLTERHVNRLFRAYKTENGLSDQRKRRHRPTYSRVQYTEDLKAKVLHAYATRGDRTVAEIAREQGVPVHRIYEWQNNAKARAREAGERANTLEQALQSYSQRTEL